ncbi:MAG TPA: CoA transferase [Gaiella sp.]
MTAILDGIVVRVLTDEPAAAVCVHHLQALGAATTEAATPPADVVLADRHTELSDSAGAALVCTFEAHAIGGGLVASETTAQAAIGLTDYVGRADGPAVRLGSDVGTVVAGFSAVQAILAWLHGGRANETRHDVAVSPLRALATLKTILWAARTRPDEWVGTHVRSRDRLVDSGYRTREGRITLDFPVGAERPWAAFVAELGLDAATTARLAERWHESVGWGDDVDLARPLYEERLAELATDDAVELVRRNGGSSVPFQTLAECLDHPQSQALGLSADGNPALPYRVEALGRLRVASSGRDPERPLADVRVVDFGVGGVGPFAATLLAWLGADVVKVEAPNEFILDVRPTVGGLSTTYLALNQGKRSVRLDLKNEADRELARGLVADADVVIENFRPGALSRVGFGFDELSSLNPRLVYCSVTGFGGVGPLSGEPCTDPHMQAFSGFAMTNADEEGLPRRIRYYGFVDLVTSTVAAEAVCAALLARRAVGGPVRVETSMLEAVTDVLRTSAKLPRHELDGLVRARDGDVAVTCRSAGDVAALRDALGLDRAGSLENIEQRLAALPVAEVVRLLGERGVAAAAVSRDEDVLTREEYRHAGLIRDLPVPHADPLAAGGPPWLGCGQLSPPAAPLPGADTAALRADPSAFWRRRPAASA